MLTLLAGSWEGQIRLWALDASLRSFRLLQTLSVPGVVNSIQILSVPAASVDSSTWKESDTASDSGAGVNGRYGNGVSGHTAGEKDSGEILLVAAVAQEPRLGRWMTVKEGVKNGVFVAHLKIA